MFLAPLVQDRVKFCLYLILAATVLRLANIWFLADSPLFSVPTSDESEHFSLAARLAAGDWFGRNEGLMMRPPLFAWVLAGLFRVFGTSFMVVHGFVLICDIVSVGLWYLVAWQCFKPKLAALAGLLMAIYWPFIHFSSTGYMESFALALNGATVLCIVVYFRRLLDGTTQCGGERAWWLLGLGGYLAGLSVLVRPTVLIVFPFIVLLILTANWARTRAWVGVGSCALFIMTIGLGLSPNAIRHAVLFNTWLPLGINGELNFNMANNDKNIGWWVTSPGLEYALYRDSPVVLGNRPMTVDAARGYWREKNQEFAWQHTGQLTRGLVLKFLQVWNAYEIHVINDFREHRELSPVERFALPSWVLFPFGFLGITVLSWLNLTGFRRWILKGESVSGRSLSQVLLIGWIVTYMMGVAIYHVNTRHRLPALPPLVIISAYGTCLSFSAIRTNIGFQKLSKKTAVYLLLLVAGCVLQWLPIIPNWMPAHEDWWTHINKGTASWKLDRKEEAAEEYRKATAIMPAKLEGWRQLSKVTEDMGDYRRAIAAQLRVLALLREQYPTYTAQQAEELDSLIKLRLKLGETGEAKGEVQELIGLAQDHWRSHLTAARVYRMSGDTTATLNEANTALSMDPTNGEIQDFVKGL